MSTGSASFEAEPQQSEQNDSDVRKGREKEKKEGNGGFERKYKEMRERFDKLKRQIDEKEGEKEEETEKENGEKPKEDRRTLRRYAFENVRKPLSFLFKVGKVTATAALPAVGTPIFVGKEVIKRTPLVRNLYPKQTIERVSDFTRDSIAKVITFPLGVTAVPRSFFGGLTGAPRLKYGGPIVKRLGDAMRWLGERLKNGLALLYRPGKERTGFVDGTVEQLWEATKGFGRGAKGFTEGTLSVIDKALTTIGLTGIKRTAAGTLLIAGAIYGYSTVASWLYSILSQGLARIGIFI